MNYPQALPILLAHGYAPASIAAHARSPQGPWAVTQPNYKLAGDAEHCAAVLAAVPPVFGTSERAITRPQATYLSLLTVTVEPGLASEVDRIVNDFAGDAKVLARLDNPGCTVYVWANDGTIPFGRLQTLAYFDNKARVESAAAFVSLQGEWRKAESPLTVPRSELAALGVGRAKELLESFNKLFEVSQPAPAPVAPRPIRQIRLPPMAKVTAGDEAAVEKLVENGYRVAAGKDDSVVLLTNWSRETQVAAVSVSTKVAAVWDMIEERFEGAPVRVASDGTKTYFLQAAGPAHNVERAFPGRKADSTIEVGAGVSITVQAHDAVVQLSGGRWTGSLLDTKRQDLPTLMGTQELLADIQRVLERRARAA